jgi:hypothetical protein
MAEYAIPNPAEFVGEWTLPDKEVSGRGPIAGSLSWSGSRATLHLNDALTPLRGAVFGNETCTYRAIHGVTVDSKLVSMLDAMAGGAGLSIGPAGFRQRETAISSWAVVGEQHVEPDTLYVEMHVRIPGLQLWLGKSGMSLTMVEPTTTTTRAFEYRIEAVPPEEVTVSSIASVLGWGLDRNFGGDLVSQITVTSAARIWLRPTQPMPLRWYFEQFGKATTLLSLTAGSPMAPDHASAVVADSRAKVEVLVGLREAKYCEFKAASDFFLVRGTLGVDLGQTLNRWFEMYESIAMPSQLALSVLSTESLWLHVEFLSLVQALEGIHRALLPGTYTSAVRYEEIRKVLSAAIPRDVAADHRDSLKSRIKYGNELSLRKRLDTLVQRLSSTLRRAIFGPAGCIPQNWVETRNYYTHWDESLRTSVLDSAGMHRAGVRLRHLLRALYLDLAGVPQVSIERALVGANRESQYLLQLNSAARRELHPEDTSGALLYVDVKDAVSPDDKGA